MSALNLLVDAGQQLVRIPRQCRLVARQVCHAFERVVDGAEVALHHSTSAQHFAQALLSRRARRPGPQPLVVLSQVARNDPGIRRVGLAPLAQRLGVKVHIAGIEHVDLHARLGSQPCQLAVVSPGGLHRDKGAGSQGAQPLGDGGAVVGQLELRGAGHAGDDEFVLGHVHAFDHGFVLHGMFSSQRIELAGAAAPAHVNLLSDRR